mmetsp:Transcript_4851/g.8826  ORF Transcript_4851/g.8826 Transcript_4851/m.8826 type:complete len:262 (+) Transcript_4851:337-1122(+)
MGPYPNAARQQSNMGPSISRGGRQAQAPAGPSSDPDGPRFGGPRGGFPAAGGTRQTLYHHRRAVGGAIPNRRLQSPGETQPKAWAGPQWSARPADPGGPGGQVHPRCRAGRAPAPRPVVWGRGDRAAVLIAAPSRRATRAVAVHRPRDRCPGAHGHVPGPAAMLRQRMPALPPRVRQCSRRAGHALAQAVDPSSPRGGGHGRPGACPPSARSAPGQHRGGWGRGSPAVLSGAHCRCGARPDGLFGSGDGLQRLHWPALAPV